LSRFKVVTLWASVVVIFAGACLAMAADIWIAGVFYPIGFAVMGLGIAGVVSVGEST